MMDFITQIREYKMKFSTILLLTSLSFFAHGTVVIWPDSSAPCNGTLQACINASNEGDTVEIHTNSPIDESLFVDVAISVVAGIGYSPVFTAGRNLQIYTASSGGAITLSVKGLTFEQGSIVVSTTNRPVIIYIENNTILDTFPNNPGIRVLPSNINSTESIIHINYNTVKIDTTSSSLENVSAINIFKAGENLGSISGELTNNTIHALGSDAIGINIFIGNDSDASLNITGNEIYGGANAGIYASRSFSTSTSDFNIVSNAIYANSTTTDSSGIFVENYSGVSNVNIINNTVINGGAGVRLTEFNGTITAVVQNNLIAYNNYGFYFDSDVDVTNDYNLTYQNNFEFSYTPGPNAINSNPYITNMQNARLVSGSPALEHGNSAALLLVDTPFIDADGLLRIKNSTSTGLGTIDVGAYEAGDISFNHINTATSGYISTINNPMIDGVSVLDSLHVTSNWNPNNTSGIYNNDNEGIYYSGGFWRIFNEGITSMANGASFNVSKFAATANTFMHLVGSSGSNSSTINHAGLDGNSQRILQVSQHWTNEYNPHPSGILYFGGNWQILNFDLQNIPINSNFNVYYQDKSKSAYEHIAKPANTAFNYTYLNNSIINGVACAQIQVTQSASQGVFNGSPIGVFYEVGLARWAIFNQNTATTMPENAAFHVLINPAQVAECSDLIYKNSFE